ncbi:hypothetical protein KDA_54240 [Dictyobacter alpinus]|uniref:Uncharacterized protein n=1 Tax=Dictyobacter alpinus TaxID=2014873 RepID=A0A402BF79_9CHLR|nr:hypothetical protein [Dictyobacter alpinus]GCE29940.1 hypothetical protein KDA_54240 [Dictyobacter alpinus]
MQQQRQQINSLIRSYTMLPGLVLATFGVLLILNGLINLYWTNWLYFIIEQRSPSLANTLALIGLLAPYGIYLLCIYAVRRYYNHHVGQVQASAPDQRMFGLEVAITIVLFLILMIMNTSYHLAISLPLLVLAAFFGVHWYILARQQYHYVLLALLTIALSITPLFSPTLYHWLFLKKAPDWYSNNISLIAGCLLLVAGFIDHILLMRRMARVRRAIQHTIQTTKAMG